MSELLKALDNHLLHEYTLQLTYTLLLEHQEVFQSYVYVSGGTVIGQHTYNHLIRLML